LLVFWLGFSLDFSHKVVNVVIPDGISTAGIYPGNGYALPDLNILEENSGIKAIALFKQIDQILEIFLPKNQYTQYYSSY
jgi:hypothetical protein